METRNRFFFLCRLVGGKAQDGGGLAECAIRSSVNTRQQGRRKIKKRAIRIQREPTHSRHARANTLECFPAREITFPFENCTTVPRLASTPEATTTSNNNEAPPRRNRKKTKARAPRSPATLPPRTREKSASVFHPPQEEQVRPRAFSSPYPLLPTLTRRRLPNPKSI